MDFININGKLDMINLDDIQFFLNSIKTKIENNDIILPKNEYYFLKIKKKFYGDFFNNLFYILFFNNNYNLKPNNDKDNIGKIIIKYSLCLFKDFINNNQKYYFKLLFQGLIFLYNTNCLDVKYFSIIISVIIKIFYTQIKSHYNLTEYSFENFDLLINCFTSFKKKINGELIKEFIKNLKDDLFSDSIIKIQLSKKQLFLNLLKIKIENPSEEGLNSIIDFLIELYKFRFTSESFDFIYSNNIKNISNLNNYFEFLIKLFNIEKEESKKEYYIKHGILIQENCPIIYYNFDFNISINCIYFSFRILEKIDKTCIFYINSPNKNIKKSFFRIYINKKLFLKLNYVDGDRINKKKISQIEVNKDYLIYFYQMDKIFNSSFIIYINGVQSKFSIKVPKIKNGILELGYKMKGILGPFIYLNNHLSNEHINKLFLLKDKYYDFLNQKDLINKYNILLNINHKYINEINPSNIVYLSENSYIELKKPEIHFKKFHHNLSFEQFINISYGIDFLILQLHNITSQYDNKYFQLYFQKIIEFILFLLAENDKLIHENSISLFFLSLIIVLFKTKIEDLKIQFNLPIIKSLNHLMLFLFNNKKYILCNIIIIILLKKQFYINDDAIKKELTQIGFCLNKNLIIPFEIILSFDYFLDDKNFDESLFTQIIEFILSVNSIENNNKLFLTLYNYISKNCCDKFEKRKSYYLKIIYLNLTYVKNLNKFFKFLNIELKKSVHKNCEYCSKIKYLSYLLIQHFFKVYINKSNKMSTISYNFMNNPDQYFLKALFIESIIDLDNRTKLKFIELNDNFKFKNIKFYELIENEDFIYNFIYIIKYYYKIYDNLKDIQLQNMIFNLINDFILLFISHFLGEKKNLKVTSQTFFNSNCLQLYYIFYINKRKDEFFSFLKGIIESLISEIYKPFFFQLIIDKKIINEEISELIIHYIINLIFKIEKIENNEIILNQYIYFLFICYYFVMKRNIPIKIETKKLITYFLFLLNDKKFCKINLEFEFELNGILINKSILIIIFEILIDLYKNDNYNQNYSKIIENILFSNFSLEENDIIKEIKKPIIVIPFYNNMKNKSKPFNNYSLLYYIGKILNLFEKYKNDKQIISILEKIYKHFYALIKEFISIYNKNSKKLKNLNEQQYNEYSKFILENKNDLKYKEIQNIYDSIDNNNINLVNLEKNEEINNNINKNILVNNLDKINFVDDENQSTNSLQIKKINNSLKIRKNKSFSYLIKKKLIINENLNENNEYETKINDIITIFFNKLIPKNLIEKSIGYLFYIKENLLWKTFSISSKNILFKNKKFKHLKQSFYSLNREKILNSKNKEYIYELPYPCILKNYTVDDYYKPFIKQDFNFFNNPQLKISHYYFDNNKEKNFRLLFKKFFPFEKSNLFFECELIYNKGSVFGEFNIYDTYLFFKDKSLEDIRLRKDLSYEQKLYYLISSPQSEFIIGKEKDILIFYSNIKEILIKRLYFKYILLEIFIDNHKTYLFNFFNDDNFSNFIKNFENKLKQTRPDLNEFNCKKIFKKKEYVKKYLNHQLTKFQFLLLINKYSTRTYNDYNQYLIFPLTHISYEPEKKRDPTKVTAVQKYIPKNDFSSFIENYQYQGYHYNIFFSAGGFIFYFLVRENPFTYSHIRFQSGKFDKRLFNSINSFLKTFLMNDDNRELIPEFFHNYYFLLNLNRNDIKQTKREIYLHNVITENFINQFEFIIKQRQKLEEFNLGPWIDIIFGINQKNENLMISFPSYVYEENNNFELKKEEFEKEGITGDKLVAHIKMFFSFQTLGVMPVKLFNKSFEDRGENKNVNLTKIKDNFISLGKKIDYKDYHIFCDKKFIYYKNDFNTFIFNYLTNLPLISIEQGKQINLLPIENSFCRLSQNLFVFGRYTDSTLKLFNEGNFKKILKWNCIVTSIISSEINNTFFIGDEKGFLSLLIFDYEKELFSSIKKQKTHNSIIRGLVLNERLDIIISYDLDNIITIHCKTSFVTLSIIEFEKNQLLCNIKISKYDIIYILIENNNKDNILMSYTLNGLKFDEFIFNYPHKIVNYYIDINNDKILIATTNELIFVECYYLSKIINKIQIEEKTQINNLVYFYDNDLYCYFLNNNNCILSK